MRRLAIAALLATTLSTGCPTAREWVSPSLELAVDGLSAERIEEHMRFLADDALEGRMTGTRGYLEAAKYVAGQFEELGLEPGGPEAEYFQSVSLLGADLVSDKSSLWSVRDGKRRQLVFEEDYVMGADFLREAAGITAPLAFVGFGVSAPALDHDDYAGIDVEGKIVVLFRGAPAGFPNDQRAYHASSRVKLPTAIAHGAVGMITMQLPSPEAWRWERVVPMSRMTSMRWVDEAGRVHDAHEELLVEVLLSEQGQAALFEGASTSLEEAIDSTERDRPNSFDLPGKLEVKSASRQHELRSPNVVGVLPGSDPVLKGEYVVLTSHLDHLGVVEGVGDGEDRIHNGAYDNASGIAIMIEVARALSTLDPRRSIVFLAVTGEERGLLGSSYFVHNPTVPLDHIVANINLDMVLMLHPLRDIVAFGAEHSSLIQPVEQAADYLGIDVSEDPIPKEVLFVRSDQYPFVRKGVPALFVTSGLDAGDQGDGGAQLRAWMKDYYHSPRDDMDQPIDFAAGADFARVNLLIAHLVAQADERPTWNEGDFFGELFGR